MGITREEVEQVAALARLRFSEDEKEQLVGQLSAILAYMGQLNELDTEGVEPTSHVLPLHNVFKEDRLEPSLPKELALANCPEQERGHYRVPRIIA